MDRRLAHDRRDARNGRPQLYPAQVGRVASLAFHAELPRLRWLAFYLGFEGGSGDAPLIFSVRPGLRFAPARELKPGVPKGFQAPTSLEVSAF